MNVHRDTKTATASANAINIRMALGDVLLTILAKNETSAFGRISIVLIPSKSATVVSSGQLLPINPQIGAKGVFWEGKTTIESPYVFVSAHFEDCIVGDELSLKVTFE